MPRNDDVLPSRRPRSFPPLTWTTGGARLGPAAGASVEATGAFSCANTFPPTLAIAPPSNVVVVLSIFRRFMRPNGSCDSFAMAAPSVNSAHYNPQRLDGDYLGPTDHRSGAGARVRIAASGRGAAGGEPHA